MNKERPSWDDVFMLIAYEMSRRSPDPHTHHGCIVVDSRHRVISTGYNGSPTECPDEALPWDKRPDKYYFSIHSEENAIYKANKRDLEGATAYITGFPCHRCVKAMLQVGISEIVFGPKTSACQDEADTSAAKLMLSFYPKVVVRAYAGNVITQAMALLRDLFETIGGGSRDRFPSFLIRLAAIITKQQVQGT